MPSGAGLPLIGAEAVVLGMSAFEANAKSVTSWMTRLVQASYYLERSSMRSASGVSSGFNAVAKASEQAARVAVRSAELQVKAAETQIKVQIQNAAATQAAAAAQVRASLTVQAAALQEARAQHALTIASVQQRATITNLAPLAQRTAAMNALTRANFGLQAAQIAQTRAAQQQGAAASTVAQTTAQNAIRSAQAQAVAVVAANAQQQAAMAATQAAALKTAAVFATVAAIVVAAVAATAVVMVAAEASAAKYNQEVAFVGALSQAASADVATLSDKQLELARSSTLSATEMAASSQELVKAGRSVAEITHDQLEAVNNLVVASKGELEAARAATIVQVAVKGFGEEAKHAADIATGAVQTSLLTFNEYSDAMRQSGGVLSSFGLDLTEFGALVSTVGQQIKSGTEIGTGLRVMFQRLQAPSAQAEEQMKKYGISLYDTNGAARPLIDILGSLQDSFSQAAIDSGKLTQAQRDHAVATIFGARSAKILEALMDEGTAGYLKQVDAVQRLKAEDLANEMLGPTAAQAKILRNQIDSLSIAFGQGLDPLVQHAMMSLNDFLRETMRIDDVRAFGSALADYMYNGFMNTVQSIGSSISAMGNFFKALAELEQAIKTFYSNVSNSALQFAANFGRITGTVIGHINNIAAASQRGAAGFGSLVTSTKNFLDDLPRLSEQASDSVERLQSELSTNTFGFTEALGRLDFSSAVYEWKNYAAEARGAIQSIADKRDEKLSKVTKGGLERNENETEPGFLPDEGAADKAAEKLADLIDKSNELVNDFNDDILKESRDTGKEITKLYRSAFDDIVKALIENEREVAKAVGEADAEFSEIEDNRNRAKSRETEVALLEQSLDAENAARSAAQAESDRLRERELEDVKRSLDFQREMQVKSIDDVLDAQDRARSERRSKEDEDFQEAQSKRDRDLESDLSGLERVLKLEQDIRDQALAARLDAEERALEASQDLRERALRTQLDAEKLARDHAQESTKLNAKEAAERAEIEKEYQNELAIGVKASIAAARRDEKLKDLNKDFGEDRRRLAEDQKEDVDDASFDKSQTSRMDALKETFQTEDLAFEKYANGEKLKLEAHHQQQVSDLEADAVRKRIELERTLKDEERARDKTRTEEDRVFDEQQEATKRAQIAKLDASERARVRKEEDEEVARRERLDRIADMNRRAQEERRRMLEVKFAQEDHQMRLDNVHKERDERIKSSNAALEDEQEKTRTKLADGLVDLKENLAEKITAIKTDYVDKLEDLAKDGGAAIMPAVTKITDHIATGLEKVRDAAVEATRKLAEAFDASEKMSIKTDKRDSNQQGSPRDWHADYNFARGTGKSEADAIAYADSFQNKQYGGVVTGKRYGEAVPIMAHVGERFEGLGGYNTALTAVRAAESMISRGLGGDTTVTDARQYNVHASYGRVQPEGTVAQDMRALLALTSS